MATNPLGLQLSGDLQVDLDQAFVNLQYLRDSLPQVTTLTADLLFNSATFAPISNQLSFPISSRVGFEAYILMDKWTSGSPSNHKVSVTGPAAPGLLAYTVTEEQWISGWDDTGIFSHGIFKVKGVCEPSIPGLLQITAKTAGTHTVFRGSHLIITLL